MVCENSVVRFFKEITSAGTVDYTDGADIRPFKGNCYEVRSH